jgi:hypothetical protein
MVEEAPPMSETHPKRSAISNYADETGATLLMLEGPEFDEYIVGVCIRFNDIFVVYDRLGIVNMLMADARASDPLLDADDAEMAAYEHFDYNILGGWHGDATPGFLVDIEGLR